MRIAVDARPLSVPIVGIGRYTLNLLEQMLFQDEDDTWYLYSDKPLIFEFGERKKVRVRTGRVKNRLMSLVWSQIVFSFWARKDRIDLFWSPRHHLPVLLPSEVKKVVSIHDLVWCYFPKTMMWQNRFLERLLMPISLKMADRIISVSKSTANDLTGNFRGIEHKINVIPEAASMMDNLDIDSTVDQPYLLFVGTLEPRKNLKRLLRAFRKVIDNGIREYALIIAGGQGWSRDSLESVVEDLSLEKSVKVLGYVEDKTLHSLYRNAYAVVLPSLYEGFGLPLLEAMQYGTPVISANVSSMPEIVGDAGILVDPLSVEEISAAMIKLLSDRVLREKLSERSIEQASRYSWKDSAMKTHDLFRALTEEQ